MIIVSLKRFGICHITTTKSVLGTQKSFFFQCILVLFRQNNYFSVNLTVPDEGQMKKNLQVRQKIFSFSQTTRYRRLQEIFKKDRKQNLLAEGWARTSAWKV